MGMVVVFICVVSILVGGGFVLGMSTGVQDGYEQGYRDGSLGYERKMGRP